MDHQPPSSDVKKPTSAPHQADEVLPAAEELRDVSSLGGITGAKDETVDAILTTADRQVETKKSS